MNINLENYQAFLLDFIEGRLDAVTVNALRQFVAQHPEIGNWEELTDDLPILESEIAIFEDKLGLLKPEIIPFGHIDEHNYESYFTALDENILTDDEQDALQQFLRLNPRLEDDFRLAGMVFLVPDKSIVFPQKANLIRKAPVVYLMTGNALRIAVAVALLVTVSLWWFRQIPDQPQNHHALVTESPATISLEKTDEAALAVRNAFEIAPAGPEMVRRKNTTPKPNPGSDTKQQERHDGLPTMQKRASGLVALTLQGTLALSNNDLETRLLIANLIESGRLNHSTGMQQRVRQAMGGLGKTIDYIQRNSERFLPENVLAAGVGVYNMLTDNNVALVKEYEAGQLQALTLESDRFGMRKTMP